MKTMKKIVCGLMTLVLLLSSVPAAFADEAKTIDQDAACSLTIWKFDYTNAKKDGVWDEDAFPSTGWQESYVENALVNTNRKGDTDQHRLCHCQTDHVVLFQYPGRFSAAHPQK